MKARKSLYISFPTETACVLFLWDGNALGYKVTHLSLTELLVKVQRRSERSNIARKARDGYRARTETLIG